MNHAFYEESYYLLLKLFKWIAMESIVGGHLRQMKDNLYSNISWSCHSSKQLCPKITFDVLYLNHV